MVIALDIDDTITRNPEFFACLSAGFAAMGHRVVVITFREKRDEVIADLRGWGIVHHEVICATTEAVLTAGVEQWKADVCRRIGVDVIFEDDAASLRHVDPSVTAFLTVHHDRHDLAAVQRQRQ